MAPPRNGKYRRIRSSYYKNMEIKKRGEDVARLLREKIPSPKSELKYENEMQFAAAVALSAQTTDKKVNEITKGLFEKYKSWEDFAQADLVKLQSDIRGVNFHLGKAERIIGMAQKVLFDFGGRLPRSMEELTTLPGIARKSANVIMAELWGKAEGIVVDTHVIRVSQRLGLTLQQDAVKIEKDLMREMPEEDWKYIGQALVLHGRYVCTARKPKCAECILNKICPSAFKLE